MCSLRAPHTFAALATWALASACASPPPPPSTPPVSAHSTQVLRIPANCERNLSGAYAHSTHPEFHYLASDDGRTLRLSLQSTQGGSPPPHPTPPGAPSDAGTRSGSEVQLVLVRGPEGFIGETRAFAYSARGTRCPVRFYTDVESCTDDGLTLRTVPALSVDDACNTVDEPPSPERLVTQQLKRLGTPPSPVPSPAPAPVKP